MLNKHKSPSSETFFTNLIYAMQQRYPDLTTVKPTALGEWAVSTPIILDGIPFTFERHEYLAALYADTHPHIVLSKAAQMGLSTYGNLRSIHSGIYKPFRGILYLFPSRTDVTEFSKSRVDPLIEENPESIGKWITDTDSANIKKIGRSYLYYRGMRSRVGLKSVPVDFIVFDEMDEADPSSVDMAMERMSHSEFREVLKLSNPTLPDYGIDKAFQETDQRYWLLKCPSCGEYTCLEDTFPKCLLEVGDRVIRACQKCQGELNPSVGEWVAKHPDVTEKRGYHFSQLFSRYVEPAAILHGFRTTNNLTEFYNLKLGIAYVEATDRLTIQEVLGLCGHDENASSDPGPCSMGIDQGRFLHVTIGKPERGRAGKIVHIGEYDGWEQLDRLMEIFNVSRCVVDAMPETRNARAFAERHRGKVYLCYYSEHQKSGARWNDEDLTVSINRTESMDASHGEIQRGRLVLPRDCKMAQEFAEHCHNTAKKLEEDEQTGSKRYVYVKLGPDHFRHSFNYEAISRHYGAESLFADCGL